MLTRQQVLYGLERVELRTTSIFDDCPLKSRDARQDVRCDKLTDVLTQISNILP